MRDNPNVDVLCPITMCKSAVVILQVCDNKCCDPKTCKLVGDAQCGNEGCCDVNTCRVRLSVCFVVPPFLLVLAS